jgi:predicted dehydrogenase
MFRLGIIGSDNSHAESYAKVANLEQGLDGRRLQNVTVTHIYGTDPERTRQVAEAARIPHVVDRKEDMIGRVDGVLCVWRHGSKHLAETLPFIEAGIPAFVDKPLAASVEDARRLIEAAAKAGIGFTSFSALRFAPSFVAFLAELRDRAGEPTAVVCTGPADRHSEYDGLYFYGIHVAELMNTTWGAGCRSVCASEQGGNVVAVCKHASGAVITLNLLGNAKYVFHMAGFGPEGWHTAEIDSKDCYYEGLKVIVQALRDGEWPLAPDDLLEPIKVLAAIKRSLKEHREIALDEV